MLSNFPATWRDACSCLSCQPWDHHLCCDAAFLKHEPWHLWSLHLSLLRITWSWITPGSVQQQPHSLLPPTAAAPSRPLTLNCSVKNHIPFCPKWKMSVYLSRLSEITKSCGLQLLVAQNITFQAYVPAMDKLQTKSKVRPRNCVCAVAHSPDKITHVPLTCPDPCILH